MNRIAFLAVVLIAAVASASCASVWGPYDPTNYAPDGTTLTIEQVVLSSSEAEWTYTVHHGAVQQPDLYEFSVGLLIADDHQLGSGHFYDYSSSEAGATVLEMSGHAMWYGFVIGAGETAWFKFKTDLPLVGLANHQARDNTYTPDWQMKETPFVPEPASIPALACGLVGLAALRRRR